MTQADRVLSTPPTSTSPSRRRSYILLEDSICNVCHMADVTENALSDADGTATLQELERLVFCVRLLCRMVGDLNTEYFEGTKVFCGKRWRDGQEAKGGSLEECSVRRSLVT